LCVALASCALASILLAAAARGDESVNATVPASRSAAGASTQRNLDPSTQRAAGASAQANAGASVQRSAMVAQIARMAAQGGPAVSERVLAALGKVPRHELVPERLREHAYEDRPLPIGAGQTISQPYVVAIMSELADVTPGEKVLEVGTGSGYQAAVLAELGARVFTIEIVEALGREAQQRLNALGYGERVRVRIGDGYKGWPDEAPYDAVVVTAAPEEVPPPLLEQLAPGGTLVVPVGGQTAVPQQLTVIKKDADGILTKRVVLPVRFVPFTRDK
jgi:protein-L-isoaspartate(D-aspartate) O-methyltransferase